jgi:hypothetical protein
MMHESIAADQFETVVGPFHRDPGNCGKHKAALSDRNRSERPTEERASVLRDDHRARCSGLCLGQDQATSAAERIPILRRRRGLTGRCRHPRGNGCGGPDRAWCSCNNRHPSGFRALYGKTGGNHRHTDLYYRSEPPSELPIGFRRVTTGSRTLETGRLRRRVRS